MIGAVIASLIEPPAPWMDPTIELMAPATSW